jgi:hypothetical protein
MTETVKVGASNKTPAEQQRSAWPAALACLCFCGVSILLLKAYGLLHWRIIHDHYSSLEGSLKTNLFRLLGFLEVYHLTALLAVAFGVWTFAGRPRWMRWVCLPLIILSLLMFIIVS